MRLKSLSFVEMEGAAQEWVLDGFSIGPKTLVVGRNASGKSRALNVIGALSRYLSGRQTPAGTAKFDCLFQDGEDNFSYQISFLSEKVVSEVLSKNGKVLLSRSVGGEGEIFASKIAGGTMVRFQAPPELLAAVVRRDSLQHPFLEPLYEWGSTLRHYYFGTFLGKDRFAVLVPDGPKPDDRDGGSVVGVFRQAQREFGDKFSGQMLEDMRQLDYFVDEVGCAAPISMRVEGDFPGEVVCLYVKEKDLTAITDQHSMSQGMFRVLSLLTHINYSKLKGSATCVLIDDIGEGLDFNRSCKLIGLLRSKADESGIQLIMSTNDRFVMNSVPLEEWSVLQRSGSVVRVRNHENSKTIFEDFKFTGLSNFSFLELDMLGAPILEGLE